VKRSPNSALHSRSVSALRDNCSALQTLHDVITVVLTAVDTAAETHSTWHMRHSSVVTTLNQSINQS